MVCATTRTRRSRRTYTTLAEVLLARGFRTGAFVGSVVLDPDRGLAQGFERYRGVAAIERPERTRARNGSDARTTS